MSSKMNCPKCHADISESYEPEDWSVGINAGWFCDACDLGVGDDGDRGPVGEDNVGIPPAPRPADGKYGTPISQLSGQPGPSRCVSLTASIAPGHPDHVRYENFTRIARSWGYD